jgi:release factor glutamine methyltransferase
MNIGRALLWGEAELQYLVRPKLEAEVLLAGVLKKNRVFLKTNLQYPLSWWEKRLYKKCVQERLKGIPVAYVLKYKQWGAFRIAVNNHVLIPRDETEVLCHLICQHPRTIEPERILDVGTGSGCIAIFLKDHFLQAQVGALDISSKALNVARKNAKAHQLQIAFLQSDLLHNLPNNDSYDLIVANLPYVPTNVPISREVSREPRGAIFSGSDGLDHFRRFAEELQKKKIEFQELWIEFLPQQKKAIGEIFSAYDVQLLPDVGEDIRFAKIVGKY